MSAPFNKFGPIINIFTDVDKNGNPVLRVQYASGKCGYVTNRGVVSGGIDEAINIFGTRTITLETYADLQAYEFKSGVPVEFTVVNDENKTRTNTFYKWTGEVLKWTPEVDNIWQPTI